MALAIGVIIRAYLAIGHSKVVFSSLCLWVDLMPLILKHLSQTLTKNNYGHVA